MKTGSKSTIRKRVLLYSILFVLVLILILSLFFYNSVETALYGDTRSHLQTVVNYLDHKIDHDDLYDCLKNNQVSEKYQALQEEMNVMVDDFELFYLYVVYPEDGVMVNIISGTSQAERAEGIEDTPLGETTDYYSKDILALYEEAMQKDEISAFTENSDWGQAYTVCKPLKNAKGEVYGLICADEDTSYLRGRLFQLVLVMLAIAAPVSLIFGALLLNNISKFVVEPIVELEYSASDYVRKIRNNKDDSIMVFTPPVYKYENEVSSLSRIIRELSLAIRDDVSEILSAKKKYTKAEKEVRNMSKLAMKDPLTHVQTPAAYKIERENIEKEIREGYTNLGMIVIDLNDLKGINDKYGHDAGNEYLYGSGKIITSTFVHSPVYRMGGDEFMVILRHGDFMNRNELLNEMSRRFEQSSHDESVEPYRRYSAAYGVAVYGEEDDDDLDKMFRRADKNMYANKKYLKEKKL